jgi:hypothetical protein
VTQQPNVLCDIWVPGAPKTKGSLDMVTRKYSRENVKGSVQWRILVAERARAWRNARGLTSPTERPVLVTGSFWLPVDDVTARGAGDDDKLTRNVLDALQAGEDRRKCAGVYVDDVQVVAIDMPKFAADDALQHVGAHVMVVELTDTQLDYMHDLCWHRSMDARGGGILR